MLTQEDFYINKFAQEKIELKEVLDWFDSKNEYAQKMVIKLVGECLKQAIPDKVKWNQDEINKMIPSIPFKTKLYSNSYFEDQTTKNCSRKNLYFTR